MTDHVPLLEVGKLLAGLEELKAKKGEPPWSDPVVLTDDIQAFKSVHMRFEIAGVSQAQAEDLVKTYRNR